MSRKAPTPGMIVLVMLMVFVFFPLMLSFISYLVNTNSQLISTVKNATGEPPSYAKPLTDAMISIISWIGFILTNPIGLAIIILISIVFLAFETEWR